MDDSFASLVARHRGGEPVGITSVCSAHPLVLEATMREAAAAVATGAAGESSEAGAAAGGLVLVEATSNQVDQHGGYTGMRPPDFRELVLRAAHAAGVPAERVVLGGDHLGPNRWRDRPAAEAMASAEELVAAYVAAGFTKLHLDCSMACADDPPRLGDGPVSARAARLARIAERTTKETAERAGTTQTLSYVIGTEVPVPGGAAEAIEHLVPTSVDAARATLRAHHRAFAEAGLEHVWPRIRGLVVQPGVEFDEWTVADYEPGRTVELQSVLDDEPGIVFEAHSTDYQTPERLAALVRDHWAILKVGPGLTFALREALFALEAIEQELCPESERSRLRAVLEARMLAHPEHWAHYYTGDEAAQRTARAYSYSDRLRYYWPEPAVDEAVRRLFANLGTVGIPLPVLGARLPLEYARVRAGELVLEPRALVLDHVAAVLREYRRACEPVAVAVG